MKPADDWLADCWDVRGSRRFSMLAWIALVVATSACLAVYIFWSGPATLLAVGGPTVVLIAQTVAASHRRARERAAASSDTPQGAPGPRSSESAGS